MAAHFNTRLNAAPNVPKQVLCICFGHQVSSTYFILGTKGFLCTASHRSDNALCKHQAIATRGPRDHENMKLLHPGSKAQDNIGIPEAMACLIPMI